MIIRPPKRIRISQVGVLLEDGKVLGEWGITDIEEVPKDAVVYAHSHSAAFSLVRSGIGEARYWRKRYTGYRFGSLSVYSARDILASLEPDEALVTLRDWKNWVEEYGANVTSLTGTSRSIWRASLPASLLIVSGRFPVPSDNLHIGGRQEGTEGTYDSARIWDIRSAYMDTMRRLWVGARYRRYGGHDLPTDCVGFARATIGLPSQEHGLLPSRTDRGFTIYPKKGTIEGNFDIRELRTAREYGSRVYIHEAWIARGLRLPWKRWGEMIASGYELPGKSSRIVKVMSNSLWGTFAVSGRGAWVHYEDGKPITVMDAREVTPPAKALSAHIAAFMRVRLLTEVLYWNKQAVISAHTDGVLLAPNGHPIERVGDDIGEWGMRADVSNLVVLTPTAYSYTDTEGHTRYVLAGTPPQFRAAIFKSMLKARSGKQGRSKLVREM